MKVENPGEQTPIEKRRWPRGEVEGECFIDRFEVGYPIRNIGPGGVRILSHKIFESGEKVRLLVSFKDGYQFETLSYVVWCSENAEEAKKSFEVGFKFIDLDPKDFQYIKDRLALKFW